MNEDAIYRSSSQYRFWSFTPAKLAHLRVESNDLASTHIRALIKGRQNTSTASSSADVTPSVSDADVKNGNSSRRLGTADVDCLSVDEEVELLKYFCNNVLELGNEAFKYPIHVTATAIQYLKRFYLTHSLMDYAPRKIIPTALFLANKTDNQMHSLNHFLEEAHEVGGWEGLTRESVLGTEFMLTQALRFQFDVRHPFRALKGITLEGHQLAHICHGHKAPEGWSKMSNEDIRDRLLKDGKISPKEFERRFLSAYDKAKQILSSDALISDAYFHYSPSQIAFAGWQCVDPDFITDFLDITLSGRVPAKEKHKIIDTIAACAKMLKEANIMTDTELKPLSKKMTKCNKMSAKDPVEASNARKRAAIDRVDEHAAKKRKMERDKLEKEGNDLFGPSLVKR
jgi:cyclin H